MADDDERQDRFFIDEGDVTVIPAKPPMKLGVTPRTTRQGFGIVEPDPEPK